MRLTFIGGGNMASALIGGLIARGQRAADVSVIDPAADCRVGLAQRLGVRVAERPDAAALAGELLVFAVKPQQMAEAAAAVAPLLSGQLVVSVAAGIRASDLSRWLGGHTRIVRAMPNTPALIGEGVTGLSALPGLSEDDRRNAEAVLGAVGPTVWVEQEAMLDAVTAVSGSGPAYVFRFMEAIEQAGITMGLTAAQARTLTLHTFIGAAKLAAASDEPLSVLRERVTSKGGTTAAALSVMTERDLPAVIAAALEAARSRSAEMGEEFGQAR